MDKISKIKAEIENQKAEYRLGRSAEAKYRMGAYTELLDFINSLPEESVSEDLEKEIQRHLKDCLDVKFPTTDIESIKKDVEFTARHFANWQKEQMMKGAIDATIEHMPNDYGEFRPCIHVKVDRSFKKGEKVKVIVIKEE